MTMTDDEDDVYGDDNESYKSKRRSLRRISSRVSLRSISRARNLRAKWRTGMPGLDGAIECAMSGMLFAQKNSSSSPTPSTIESEEGKKRVSFVLARPIGQGIRDRIGFLRKRADTAPAKLQTQTLSSGARFIAGDVGGLHGPVRLIDPLTRSSGIWGRGVLG